MLSNVTSMFSVAERNAKLTVTTDILEHNAKPILEVLSPNAAKSSPYVFFVVERSNGKLTVEVLRC